MLLVDATTTCPTARVDLRARCMAAASADYEIAPTEPETTGAAPLHERHDRHAEGGGARPRGDRRRTTRRPRFALDLHADDVFWCTADPGWVTGTSYGIVAPLAHGVTSVVDEGDFDAERWYRILAERAGHRAGTRPRPRSG